jgi:phenylacetate-CoA ligase
LNVDWLAGLPAWSRRLLYFGLQAPLGARILSTWREFQAWERFSREQLEQVIEERLSRLLATATTQVEHYRALGLQRRPGERAIDFLRRFPTLTRAQVRDHFAQLVIDPLRSEIRSPASVSRRRYDWLVVKTGGTTGEPTSVVHDARARDSGRATRLYAARQCGFPLGTPYFRLWGSEAELFQQQRSFPQRVLSGLLGEIPLNAFRAKEPELRRHLATMLANSQVQHLMTYVDAGVSLALFIQDQKLPRPMLKTIMACAGTVLPEYRRLLEEIFQARVFDKYGSRECSDMACECAYHTGLHVFSPHLYLEIVDEDGHACLPGQVGRLQVTLLNNLGFPMIRYDVGDLAAWAEPGPCPCGSPFPRIQSLQGREDDMLLTEDGTWQSSVFVRHFVGVSLNRQLIREWQLEQTGRKNFVFRYIPLRQEGLSENLEQIKDAFLLVFGKTCVIDMQQVQEIPPSASGKVRWIINSYRKRRSEEK